MIFIKNCSFVNGGYEFFHTDADYREWKKGNTDAIKLLDSDTNPEMEALEITADTGFLRVPKKTGGSVSIPFVHVFVNGEKTSISKLFRRYWYHLLD